MLIDESINKFALSIKVNIYYYHQYYQLHYSES